MAEPAIDVTHLTEPQSVLLAHAEQREEQAEHYDKNAARMEAHAADRREEAARCREEAAACRAAAAALGGGGGKPMPETERGTSEAPPLHDGGEKAVEAWNRRNTRQKEPISGPMADRDENGRLRTVMVDP